MLDKDTRDRLMDFFEPSELVEYLIEGGFAEFDDIIEALEPEIDRALEDLEELMGVRNGGD